MVNKKGMDLLHIIFLHGLGQEASSWNHTLSLLARSSSFYFQMSCPPLFLRKQDEMSYLGLYHYFEKMWNQESEPLNFCGISLGAILALNYAVDHPKKVQSLVLIAPQYKVPSFLLKGQNLIFRILPNSIFQKGMNLTKEEVLSLTHSMMDLNLEDQLNLISCPTLVICGQKDKANQKAALKLKEKIPLAHLIMIEGVGHEVNVEAPNQLAHLLNRFYLRLAHFKRK